MKLGRWKTPSMFHRYDIIDEQDLNGTWRRWWPRWRGEMMTEAVSIDCPHYRAGC